MIGVYVIENKINNKVYIGSSTNINYRKIEHFSRLRCGRHYNQHLQRAWNKYGEENFVFSIVFVCSTELLLKAEQWYIDNINPEYNISTDVVAPKRGQVVTDEVKNKLSIEYSGHGNPFFGKSHSSKTIIVFKINNTGESNPNSKLTQEDVDNIRYLYETGLWSMTELSYHFNVSITQISRIVNNKAWVKMNHDILTKDEVKSIFKEWVAKGGNTDYVGNTNRHLLGRAGLNRMVTDYNLPTSLRPYRNDTPTYMQRRLQ